MRMPDRNDLIDYVEHSAGQDSEVQMRILHLLASSQILREQVAELKRDLYMVTTQIPDYVPEPAFGAELLRLSQTWMQTLYARKFSWKTFYRSREFFALFLALAGGVFLVLTMLGWKLLGRP